MVIDATRLPVLERWRRAFAALGKLLADPERVDEVRVFSNRMSDRNVVVVRLGTAIAVSRRKMMRDLQHRAVDSIKRHALTISLRSRKAQTQVLQEYLWIEEGAEAIALDRIPPEAPWLGKLVTRQLSDEERHAKLLRARLAELGVASTRPPPSILRVKLWWLDRVCAPYRQAFEAGPVVVLLAVAAQLETTGVRMFERHLGVLDTLAPDDPTGDLLRSILADERRHAKSCASAARKLLRDHEHAAFDELCERAAMVDRSFGITISLGFWLNIAATTFRDRARGRDRAVTRGKAAA